MQKFKKLTYSLDIKYGVDNQKCYSTIKKSNFVLINQVGMNPTLNLKYLAF